MLAFVKHNTAAVFLSSKMSSLELIYLSVLNLVSDFRVLHVDKCKLLKGLRVFCSLREMRYHIPFEFQ